MCTIFIVSVLCYCIQWSVLPIPFLLSFLFLIVIVIIIMNMNIAPQLRTGGIASGRVCGNARVSCQWKGCEEGKDCARGSE